MSRDAFDETITYAQSSLMPLFFSFFFCFLKVHNFLSNQGKMLMLRSAPRAVEMRGTLVNMNTLEGFQKLDKNKLFSATAQAVSIA